MKNNLEANITEGGEEERRALTILDRQVERARSEALEESALRNDE